MNEFLEFLKKNSGGGMRLSNGDIISLSGYMNNWIKGVESGKMGEEDVKRSFRSLVKRREGVKSGNNLGVFLMEEWGIDEGYEVGEKRINIRVSLEELGWLCLGLEEALGNRIYLDGIEWKVEKLNERLVEILEREDK